MNQKEKHLRSGQEKVQGELCLHASFIDKSVCLLKLRLVNRTVKWSAREASSDHSREYPRTAGNTHFDHDQPEKGVHCIRTDVHSIRNLFVGEAEQQ
jgi:hypothetical protein